MVEQNSYLICSFCFQRDPFLLMLLLMGRHPGMLIPDDVDASDYEVSDWFHSHICDVIFHCSVNSILASVRLVQYDWFVFSSPEPLGSLVSL